MTCQCIFMLNKVECWFDICYPSISLEFILVEMYALKELSFRISFVICWLIHWILRQVNPWVILCRRLLKFDTFTIWRVSVVILFLSQSFDRVYLITWEVYGPTLFIGGWMFFRDLIILLGSVVSNRFFMFFALLKVLRMRGFYIPSICILPSMNIHLSILVEVPIKVWKNEIVFCGIWFFALGRSLHSSLARNFFYFF